MRVAIEAASLGLSSGGLARYTAELSLALARCFPDDEYFLISDQPFRMPPGSPSNLKRGGGPRNSMERRWWLWGMAREMSRLGADLVHGPDFAVPYIPRRPSVLTLHDLSPWMKASWRPAAKRVRRRTPILLDLGIATMIVTPGEAVRKQAIERFRLRPDRVVAVPEAAAAWFRPVAAGCPRRRISSSWARSSRARTCRRWWRPGVKCGGTTPSTWCWPGGGARIFPLGRKNRGCA
jgi:hypothetical protein